jgi:MFS family permease
VAGGNDQAAGLGGHLVHRHPLVPQRRPQEGHVEARVEEGLGHAGALLHDQARVGVAGDEPSIPTRNSGGSPCAGLAIAPGPLMVALLSWPAGALAGRVGARRLVLPGAALLAAACAWWIAAAGTTPDHLNDMLAPTILTGAGVALTFPTLAGAAVSALPPERTATGSALFNMARQIGGVVGIAAFVAILGAGAPDLAGFRAGWAMMAVAALAAGAVAALLPAPGRTAPAERGSAGTSSATAP